MTNSLTALAEEIRVSVRAMPDNNSVQIEVLKAEVTRQITDLEQKQQKDRERRLAMVGTWSLVVVVSAVLLLFGAMALSIIKRDITASESPHYRLRFEDLEAQENG